MKLVHVDQVKCVYVQSSLTAIYLALTGSVFCICLGKLTEFSITLGCFECTLNNLSDDALSVSCKSRVAVCFCISTWSHLSISTSKNKEFAVVGSVWLSSLFLYIEIYLGCQKAEVSLLKIKHFLLLV